ncbi:MAG: hypothetical protein HQM09_23695 [Candidatus Riflebacteria bacterium]|nr:hypothetical protein [Candidatus Riflebacteria bacterium]
MNAFRKGMAIPLVLLFAMVFSVFMFSVVSTRTTVRKQSLASQTQKKAYYMAMGAIQHALLKLRLFPREAYKSGSLARGVCPYFNLHEGGAAISSTVAANNVYLQAMSIFQSDINSTSVPFRFSTETEFSGAHPWRYEISSFSVSTYYTKTSGTEAGMIREVATVKCMGYSYDIRDSQQERIEYVEKQVELKRQIK